MEQRISLITLGVSGLKKIPRILRFAGMARFNGKAVRRDFLWR